MLPLLSKAPDVFDLIKGETNMPEKEKKVCPRCKKNTNELFYCLENDCKTIFCILGCLMSYYHSIEVKEVHVHCPNCKSENVKSDLGP
jgi:hypothetical protein